MYEQELNHFHNILVDQSKRMERLKNADPAKDFKSLDHITIGVIGGDGIGPIIAQQASRVMEHLLADDIQSGRIEIKNIEGLTIENRIAKNQTIPDDVMAEIKSCDVLLKGPTTTPQKGSGMPNLESANVAMRKALDLYANVRPVCVPDQNIDWTFFRENTEGEYALGSLGLDVDDDFSVDFKVISNCGTYRIAKAAFEFAKNNNKDNVAIVTKANIMKKTDGRFSQIAHEVAKDYPGIEVDEYYVDIMSANLVKEDSRSKFKVFLLPNLYGDIITDEAAQIQGGVGTAGSANIGDQYAMFEAIHGSAPRVIEQGRGQYANPASMIKATEMLLRHISYNDKADALQAAMDTAAQHPEKLATGKTDGATAQQYTDYLLSCLG